MKILDEKPYRSGALNLNNNKVRVTLDMDIKQLPSLKRFVSDHNPNRKGTFCWRVKPNLHGPQVQDFINKLPREVSFTAKVIPTGIVSNTLTSSFIDSFKVLYFHDEQVD